MRLANCLQSACLGRLHVGRFEGRRRLYSGVDVLVGDILVATVRLDRTGLPLGLAVCLDAIAEYLRQSCRRCCRTARSRFVAVPRSRTPIAAHVASEAVYHGRSMTRREIAAQSSRERQPDGANLGPTPFTSAGRTRPVNRKCLLGFLPIPGLVTMAVLACSDKSPIDQRRCCTARSKWLTSLCRSPSHPAQYVSGMPSAVILLSISHPIRCSTRCLANVRARISDPMCVFQPS